MPPILYLALPWWRERDLERALAHLVSANMVELREHPLPLLYESGVRYVRETRLPNGMRREVWRSAHVVFWHKGGDCEDLCSWRAAELRLAGEPARAFPTHTSAGFHIRVRRGNGAIEDPSKLLGMT